jgi:hypothetical protein
VLYREISSAFNITNTEKLLCIVHDLRFPEDAIRVIAELNNDVVTKIRLYFAQTAQQQKQHSNRTSTKMEAGTTRVHTLFPLLLLTFIEPHLRWWHQEAQAMSMAA